MEFGVNLNIGSDVDEEFKKLLASIPDKLKQIQGIGELDPFVLAQNYFQSNTVADASIDANANMSGKSPVSFQSEIFKPQLKYRSYYEMWQRLKDKYDLDTANDCIESCVTNALYFHDITKIDEPYCFAFDTSFMMTEGRPYGWLPSVAPKRSNSFMSQLVESTMDMSQEHAGAIGIANLVVNLAYFTRKERGNLHERIQYCVDTYPLGVGNQEFSNNLLLRMNIADSIEVYMDGLGCDKDLIQAELQQFLDTEGGNIAQQANEIVDIIYDKHVQNLFQNFVHIMHNTFRIGGDSPFTNMSLFDKLTFKTVFADAKYPDYSAVTDNYEEVNHLQHIFVEFFHKGSPTNGKNYRFPVVTANIKTNSEGKIEDIEFFKYIVLKNKVRGAFNIHVGEKVATCCRLTSDLSKLKDEIRMDTFGNGGLSIGSHRVVAINLHRMALISKYGNQTIEQVIDEYLAKAEKLLIVHKELLKERVGQKFLKFFNIGWEDLNMFFSTFGYTGLIDAFSVYTGKPIEDIVSDEAELNEYVYFANDVLDRMDAYATAAGGRTPHTAYNVEEIPAENASPKMAQSDNFLYSGYVNLDEDDPSQDYIPVELLSNQMIPLYCNVPMMRRLEISGKLMNKVSGGSILHLNLTEQVTDEAYLELVKMMIEKYKIPHFALNVGTSVCPDGHTTPGIFKDCPECGKEIVDWNIRVVGFNTDVSAWSKERREEFKRRQFYGAKDVTAKNIL